MELRRLLNNIYFKEISKEFVNIDISSICCDSRKATEGCLFIACKGYEHDGNHFIEEAVQKGAKVVVSQTVIDIKNICFLHVEDTALFLREIALRFYDDPSRKINTIGITGTNGKTTITYLLEAVFNQVYKKCGVMGTINHRMGDKVFPSYNTTPGLLENQQLLSEMLKEKMDYCLMEVSSHALDQGRVEGVDFKQAVFTNLTEEHLDYHQNKEEYFQVKAKLFLGLLCESTAVINRDDFYAERLMKMTSAKVLTYGIDHQADIQAEDMQYKLTGTHFTVIFQGEKFLFKTHLMGQYNVYNILAVIAVCLGEGLLMEDIQKGIELFLCVPGRLERFEGSQDYLILIDYAHTPDALSNVLRAVREVSDKKIILVFGCGGDRDKTKRAPMGKIAGALADFSIVTSDNPRGEDANSIIQDIVKGFEVDNYERVENRKEAIKKALEIAQKDCIILITGKGHETYQIIGKQRFAFDEREIIGECLR